MRNEVGNFQPALLRKFQSALTRGDRIARCGDPAAGIFSDLLPVKPFHSERFGMPALCR
jgi:hypothetical protein